MKQTSGGGWQYPNLQLQKHRDHPAHADPDYAQREGQPRRVKRHRMQVRIRHHERLREHGRVQIAARLRRPIAVSANIAGLSPNTEYHFRVITKSSAETIDGPDIAFRTLPVTAPSVETKGSGGRRRKISDAVCERQPPRRQRQQMHIRIRHEHQLRVERLLHIAPRVRVEPSTCIRVHRVRPRRQHRIPLPDLGDQLGGDKQRRRRDIQDVLKEHSRGQLPTSIRSPQPWQCLSLQID